MQQIKDMTELDALYGAPAPTSLAKVTPVITPLYKRWIEAARFVVLSTVGPEGVDGSPRGDDGPVVRISSPREIWLPDWQGNNRLDCLRNILRDGRVALMFMVHGSNNVVRANGRAIVTADQAACKSFEQKGKHPKTVIIITVEELYFQCAKALMRSALWSPDTAADVPTAGQFIKEMQADFDGMAYDAGYATYAKGRMW